MKKIFYLELKYSNSVKFFTDNFNIEVLADKIELFAQELMKSAKKNNVKLEFVSII